MKILVIDDAKLSHHVLQKYLQEAGFSQIKQLNNTKDIHNILATYEPDIVILDWMMPEIDGLGVTNIIRALDKKNQKDTGILMVTGKDKGTAMSEAFDNGVDDFIAKSDVANQLIPRINLLSKKIVKARQDQQDHLKLLKKIKQLHQLITLDPVSKLPTIAAAEQHFQQLIAHSCTRHTQLFAVQIQLESYSDLVGSVAPKNLQLLMKDFAQRIKKLIRPLDFLARVERNQFLILAPEDSTKPYPSFERFERSLNNISVYTPQGFRTLSVKVTAAKIETNLCPAQSSITDLIAFLKNCQTTKTTRALRSRLTWPEVEEKFTACEQESLIFEPS